MRRDRTTPSWIDNAADLAALAEVLLRSPHHVLDTESNSGFAYREKLCLLQFNVDGNVWLVDLVALEREGTAIEILRPALEDADRRTYLHGGEFDVGCLKRDFGLLLAGIWDTQQAASLLNWEKTGYGALVEKICGVELAKAHGYFNWARRPLPTEALSYAADDVSYLPQIAEALEEEIRRFDLEEELTIACGAVEEASWNGEHRSDGFWRMKGVAQLDAAALSRLSGLWAWRDEMARRRDLPPGKVLNHRLLVAVSSQQPRSVRELRRLGLSPRTLRLVGDPLLSELHRLSRQPAEVPPRPEREEEPPSTIQKGRSRRLRQWRRQEAERRQVAEQAVLPSRALEFLARQGGGDLAATPMLGEKRRRLYGEILERLADPGESA